MWLAGGRLELAGPDNLLLDESDQRQGPSQGQDQESEREESVASLRESAKAGALQRARALFECAHCEVSPKSTAQVVLECARLEEYVGNGALARQLLRRACRDVSRCLCTEAVSLPSQSPPLVFASLFVY